MLGTYSTGTKDKLLEEMEIRNDDYAILTSRVKFTFITSDDLKEIRDYGWNEADLERMFSQSDAADQITRLAAWIRECGEYDHGVVINDDPYYAYPLDEDGNYKEPQEAF